MISESATAGNVDVAALLQQNQMLKAELDAYRQRELEALSQRLAEAEASAEHYRAEAQRNADLGKEIAAGYERKLVELQTKIEVYERTELRANRRTVAPGR